MTHDLRQLPYLFLQAFVIGLTSINPALSSSCEEQYDDCQTRCESQFFPPTACYHECHEAFNACHGESLPSKTLHEDLWAPENDDRLEEHDHSSHHGHRH